MMLYSILGLAVLSCLSGVTSQEGNDVIFPPNQQGRSREAGDVWIKSESRQRKIRSTRRDQVGPNVAPDYSPHGPQWSRLGQGQDSTLPHLSHQSQVLEHDSQVLPLLPVNKVLKHRPQVPQMSHVSQVVEHNSHLPPSAQVNKAPKVFHTPHLKRQSKDPQYLGRDEKSVERPRVQYPESLSKLSAEEIRYLLENTNILEDSDALRDLDQLNVLHYQDILNDLNSKTLQLDRTEYLNKEQEKRIDPAENHGTNAVGNSAANSQDNLEYHFTGSGERPRGERQQKDLLYLGRNEKSVGNPPKINDEDLANLSPEEIFRVLDNYNVFDASGVLKDLEHVNYQDFLKVLNSKARQQDYTEYLNNEGDTNTEENSDTNEIENSLSHPQNNVEPHLTDSDNPSSRYTNNNTIGSVHNDDDDDDDDYDDDDDDDDHDDDHDDDDEYGWGDSIEDWDYGGHQVNNKLEGSAAVARSAGERVADSTVQNWSAEKLRRSVDREDESRDEEKVGVERRFIYLGHMRRAGSRRRQERNGRHRSDHRHHA